MAEGVMSKLVAKAIESLAKSAFKEAASWWNARGDLKRLEITIRMIQARVRDAELRQEEEGSESIKLWLWRLKQVLYRADDLFDEVLTLDQQTLQMERSTLAKIDFLYSRSCPIFRSKKLANEIKSIRKELDAIKSDMDSLNLRVLVANDLQQPTDRLLKKRETGSFVKPGEVIGREKDIDMIIEMLFDPKYDGERVTVIPIVGLGGLGKTTLAQFIFNEDCVQKYFSLIKWACVPEIGNQRAVLEKVHKSVTGMNSSDLSLDEIKSGIRMSIDDEKYLLVLDDIWDESRDRWMDLLHLLECGRIGSKVIVTTRSDEVAYIVGTIPKPYRLGLLTEEDSWKLFKRMAFKSEQEKSNPNFIQIGKDIVDKCGNVPLAIRVVGSLLYSKNNNEEAWQLFKDELLKAKLMNTSIMPELKLSYDYLLPALKQCFAYCSTFPKDYEFKKDGLVHLWMAQGYFEPSNRDIGKGYFLE